MRLQRYDAVLYTRAFRDFFSWGPMHVLRRRKAHYLYILIIFAL
uniref:Uncharacterized protein n=1 Tax=Ciona intestinalis TaxID=7719 RepID=H2Y1M7_CIOIN